MKLNQLTPIKTKVTGFLWWRKHYTAFVCTKCPDYETPFVETTATGAVTLLQMMSSHVVREHTSAKHCHFCSGTKKYEIVGPLGELVEVDCVHC